MDNRAKRIDTLNSLGKYGEKEKTPIRRKIVKTEDDLSKASMVDKLKGALKSDGSALDSLKSAVDTPSTAGTLRDGEKRRRKQMSDAGA